MAKSPKKSSSLRQREAEKLRRARLSASAANTRGRRVSATVSDYEKVCASGQKRLVGALIARHVQRMEQLPALDEVCRYQTISALTPVHPLDRVLRDMLATPKVPRQSHELILRLLWGVDSAVATGRLLLAGQVMGAAALSRHQMEAWVGHRAGSLGLSQRKGEPTADFVARTWSIEDELGAQWFEEHAALMTMLADDADEAAALTDPPTDHRHVYRSDGTDICPPLVFSMLSEIMHGREFPQAAVWDASLLSGEYEQLQTARAAVMVVCDSVALSLREVKLATIALARRYGLPRTVDLLISLGDTVSAAETTLDKFVAIPFGNPRGRDVESPPLATLAPLLPDEGLSSWAVHQTKALADDFIEVTKGRRPAGRHYMDDELIVRTFAWHRLQRIQLAQQALRAERRALGAAFDLRSLSGRAPRWIFVSEAAGLLALWHPQHGVQAAAASLCSTLRSASWLWLEDDDRAMSVLRGTLESVAQLRTWRLKPERALRMSENPKTTPRDWLERAGWKRLGRLNDVLGQFAHARSMDKWPTLRQFLADMQPDVDPKKALFTARGAALELVLVLAAREVARLMGEVSPVVGIHLAELFERAGLPTSDNDEDVEARFAHIWSLRAQAT